MKSLAVLDPGPCVCQMEGSCLCTSEERVLRMYGSRSPKLPPMTPEQREECLSEIGRVEGYDRRDYEKRDDSQLANGVLCAWTDYCRDKGLM